VNDTFVSSSETRQMRSASSVPGSESYDKLQLLSVIGTQTVHPNL
jgi:hypothetical protein